MTIRFAIFACAVVSLACLGSPAEAGQHWQWNHGHWRATYETIYQLQNEIALLEADPAVDDGYKAPIISRSSRRCSKAARDAAPGALALDGSLLLQPQANLHSMI